MATQLLLTIDLPRISIGRVTTATIWDQILAAVPVAAWPPAGGPLRQPDGRATWRVEDGRPRLVWE
jgi:hypothetical protein